MASHSPTHPPRPRPSPVRSEPLEDGERPAPAMRMPSSGGSFALAIALIAFGSIGWLAGGKYTVEGWTVALNMFLRWLGAPAALPTPTGWLLIALIAGISVVYSRVELLIWQKSRRRLPIFWAGWLLIAGTDVATTLLGILFPPAEAAPLFHQLAALPPLAIVWAVVLTFMPEWLILGSIKLLRR